MDPEAKIRVGDLMSTPVVTIEPTASLVEAADEMSSESINALVVTSEPPGIITASDLVDVISDGRDPASVAVAASMTESLETITPETSLREAASVMTDNGIKHLPVTETDDVAGMVSSTDIACYLPRYEPPG